MPATQPQPEARSFSDPYADQNQAQDHGEHGVTRDGDGL
jgi:hypothetical protein